MKTQWKNVWVKAIIWLACEIILNLLGLDNLADYSEFIFDRELKIATSQPRITFVTPHRRPVKLPTYCVFHGSLVTAR